MTSAGWRTTIVALLCAGGAVLALLSLVFVVTGSQWWRTFFAVTSEQNMPTWYSAAVLLVVALVAGMVGALARRTDRRLAHRWWVLAVVFVALSIDELVSLHEQLGTLGAQVLEPGGVFHFAWVVPGLVVAAVTVTAVVQLARRLPAPARREMYLGIGVFFAAAVGLEMVGGLVLDSIGTGWTYQVVSTTEEFAEIVGAAIVLHACLRMIDLAPAGRGVDLRYAVLA